MAPKKHLPDEFLLIWERYKTPIQVKAYNKHEAYQSYLQIFNPYKMVAFQLSTPSLGVPNEISIVCNKLGNPKKSKSQMFNTLCIRIKRYNTITFAGIYLRME